LLSDGSRSGEKGSKSVEESLNIKSDVSKVLGLTSLDTALQCGRVERGGREIVLAGLSLDVGDVDSLGSGDVDSLGSGDVDDLEGCEDCLGCKDCLGGREGCSLGG